MLTRGIHHYSIKCADEAALDNVKRFYSETLGMPVTSSFDNGCMIDSGSGFVEAFIGESSAEMGAIRHIAFRVDDAALCAKTVKEAGYEVFMEPKEIQIPCHAIIAFCYGPCGEQVEFFQVL